MPTFKSNPFRSSNYSPSSLGERIGITYRRKLASHPFLMFGLPFIFVIVASSFLLTPATALRFELHDRKNRAVTTSESMQLGLKGGEEGNVNYNPRRRKVTMGADSQRDEYYVSLVWLASRRADVLIPRAETYGERSGQLGAEEGREVERRARRKDVKRRSH